MPASAYRAAGPSGPKAGELLLCPFLGWVWGFLFFFFLLVGGCEIVAGSWREDQLSRGGDRGEDLEGWRRVCRAWDQGGALLRGGKVRFGVFPRWLQLGCWDLDVLHSPRWGAGTWGGSPTQVGFPWQSSAGASGEDSPAARRGNVPKPGDGSVWLPQKGTEGGVSVCTCLVLAQGRVLLARRGCRG